MSPKCISNTIFISVGMYYRELMSVDDCYMEFVIWEESEGLDNVKSIN